MDKQQHYCPICAEPVASDAIICPRCGSNIQEWEHKTYTEKLIQALKHPLADIRMRAIIVLGMRRDQAAEQALVDCALFYSGDVIQALEIVHTLYLMREGEETSWALAVLAERHPVRSVRDSARRTLARLAGGRQKPRSSSAQLPRAPGWMTRLLSAIREIRVWS